MNKTKNPTPSAEQSGDKDDARREALRTLGKAALYAAPAGLAVSEFEHSR